MKATSIVIYIHVYCNGESRAVRLFGLYYLMPHYTCTVFATVQYGGLRNYNLHPRFVSFLYERAAQLACGINVELSGRQYTCDRFVIDPCTPVTQFERCNAQNNDQEEGRERERRREPRVETLQEYSRILINATCT